MNNLKLYETLISGIKRALNENMPFLETCGDDSYKVYICSPEEKEFILKNAPRHLDNETGDSTYFKLRNIILSDDEMHGDLCGEIQFDDYHFMTYSSMFFHDYASGLEYVVYLDGQDCKKNNKFHTPAKL